VKVQFPCRFPNAGILVYLHAFWFMETNTRNCISQTGLEANGWSVLLEEKGVKLDFP